MSEQDIPGSRGFNSRIATIITLATGLAWGWTGHARAAEADLTDLSLEQLMDVEVVSASKYSQRIADAPASVTVIRAADIRQFGYRSLADILRSVRGFHISYDRLYEQAGVRGFSPPGDYNTRLLVLVDGRRINDNVYDTGAIGGEFPLDVDLIDRVEIVRGPSSSLYGSNALFGVVNVITRRGRDLEGAEASVSTGSYGERAGRFSWGNRLESGLEMLISASSLKRDGGSPYFSDFDSPSTNNGRAAGTDFERRDQFFSKLEYDGWSLTLNGARRDKGLTGGAFGVDFSDPASHVVDAQNGMDLGYRQILESGVEASGRLYVGSYRYYGDYMYDVQNGKSLNRDQANGNWWGGEARMVATAGQHKLAYGLEFQRNTRQNQRNFDLSPYALVLDDRRQSSRSGIYVQDDFPIAERWTLSAGLRYDHTSIGGGNVSPRLGLIHPTDGGSVWKFLYGSAYRTPNVYERYYAFRDQQAANPNLNSERIKTYEVVWEHTIEPGFQLVGSIYHYTIQDWIVQQADPVTGLSQFVNNRPVHANGFEFEADRHWRNGTRLRASYSTQYAPEHSDAGLNQAPRHLVKANLSTPLWQSSWSTGLEYQYVSSRTTLSDRVGAVNLVNATLLYRPRAGGPELALSLYNLFDQRYADPVSDPGQPQRESIVQDGRTWRLKATIPF